LKIKIIPIHSLVNITTNSSSETFVRMSILDSETSIELLNQFIALKGETEDWMGDYGVLKTHHQIKTMLWSETEDYDSVAEYYPVLLEQLDYDPGYRDALKAYLYSDDEDTPFGNEYARFLFTIFTEGDWDVSSSRCGSLVGFTDISSWSS
jgi:hypothetical protein